MLCLVAPVSGDGYLKRDLEPSGLWVCVSAWDGGAESQSCAKLSALGPTVSPCGSPEDASGFIDA